MEIKAKKIVFVGSSSGDWEGMYIDGELVMEGHSLSVQQVLCKLGVAHTSVKAADGWLEDRGNLPSKFKDVETA